MKKWSFVNTTVPGIETNTPLINFVFMGIKINVLSEIELITPQYTLKMIDNFET
jgi:hypothetical protein